MRVTFAAVIFICMILPGGFVLLAARAALGHARSRRGQVDALALGALAMLAVAGLAVVGFAQANVVLYDLRYQEARAERCEARALGSDSDELAPLVPPPEEQPKPEPAPAPPREPDPLVPDPPKPEDNP